MLSFGPPVFSDGERGSLIFTSTALLAKARGELQRLAQSVEDRLVTLIQTQTLLIQTTKESREALKQKVEKQKAKVVELRARIDKLKSKV